MAKLRHALVKCMLDTDQRWTSGRGDSTLRGDWGPVMSEHGAISGEVDIPYSDLDGAVSKDEMSLTISTVASFILGSRPNRRMASDDRADQGCSSRRRCRSQ